MNHTGFTVDLAVDLTGDPAAFLAVAEPHLALDPVLSTVVSSVTHRALEDAAEQAGRADDGAASGYQSEDDMRDRIAAGRVWFWEDESGEPVHLLADGARVCLFTDQANPTSNRIARRSGSRRWWTWQTSSSSRP